MTIFRICFCLGVVLFVSGLATTEVAAKAAGPSGGVPSLSQLGEAADAQHLVAQMSDPQVRQVLLDEIAHTARLKADRATGQVQNSALDRIEVALGLALHRLQATLRDVPQMGSDLLRVIDRLVDGRGAVRLVWMLLIIAALLAGGGLIERAARRRRHAFRQHLQAAPSMTRLQRLGTALLGLALNLIDLALFALGSALLFVLATGGGASAWRVLFVAGLLAVLCARAVTALSRCLIAPASSQLRLFPMGDAAAQRLHAGVTLLGHYSAWSYILVILLNRLGAAPSTRIFISLVLGTLGIVWVALLIWRQRDTVGQALTTTREGQADGAIWLQQQLASVWHVLALAYLAGVWLVWVVQLLSAQGLRIRGALAIGLLVIPLYLLLERLGQWLVSMALERGGNLEEQPALAASAFPSLAERWARCGVRILIALILGLWLLKVLGLSLPFTDMLQRAGFIILLAVAAAQLAWHALNGIIERKLQELAPTQGLEGEELDEEAGGIATDRRYTLLPVLRTFLATILIVMLAMIALSSLGMDIGPLLAGAGVAGLAIGFGAQKLVHDILSGMFFLIDDAFRVGEYIQAGGVDGTVETITLRNLKLRSPKGTLQLIPYSELGSVTNFMRGALREKITLNLPYDTDIETVRKTIKKVGQALQADAHLGPHIVQPLKSQGVKSVADSVMSFQAKFAAKPGKQFIVKREAFKRLRAELEKKGIFFAHRKVIVELSPHAFS